LEKRYLRHLEQPADREFFRSCFTAEQASLRIRRDLDRKEGDKLRSLLKAIRANRKGAVKFAPLIIAAALAGGLIFFFTVMLNPLLERALETALETVFEARSDVKGFRLRLTKFSVGIDSVTVANRDRPMRNLFQIGRVSFSLRPQAVLQGKVYIEELRADSIRFDTPREQSGALPERPAKAKAPKAPRPEAPPLVDLKNFDARGLLDREFDKLSTPKLYDQAVAAYEDTLARWKGRAELVKTRSAELSAAAQPLLRLDINSLNPLSPGGIEAVTTVIRDISDMVDRVQNTASEAADLVRGLEDDIRAAEDLVQGARDSVETDFARLKSYVNFESGAAFAALEPSIREVLSDAAEQYLDYGLRAIEILEKLRSQPAGGQPAGGPAAFLSDAGSLFKAGGKAKDKQGKKAPFKGRDVRYPSLRYPKFYLGVLSSDFTLAGWNYGIGLEGVSSDPDLYPSRPAALSLSFSETGGPRRRAGFTGTLDLRNGAGGAYAAELEGAGFPLSLEREFARAGIRGFSGTGAFSLGLRGSSVGDWAGGGGISIAGARLLEPEGTLAEAVDAAIREAGEVRLALEFAHPVQGDGRFVITTNIGELVRRALEQMVRSYADRAVRELERVLRERIGSYIEGRFASQRELDLIFAAARGDKSAVDGLKGRLEEKKGEFERRLRGAAEQAKQEAERIAEEAKQEALRQAGEAARDVLQGKQPSFQMPSLPQLPSLPGKK
jgi:hypothetical protein